MTENETLNQKANKKLLKFFINFFHYFFWCSQLGILSYLFTYLVEVLQRLLYTEANLLPSLSVTGIPKQSKQQLLQLFHCARKWYEHFKMIPHLHPLWYPVCLSPHLLHHLRICTCSFKPFTSSIINLYLIVVPFLVLYLMTQST